MEPKDSTLDNNVILLTSEKFIEIITGRVKTHYYPLYTHQEVSENERIRNAELTGEPYDLMPITVPETALTPFWIRNTLAKASGRGIDDKRPIITNINNAHVTTYALRGVLNQNYVSLRSNEPLKSVVIPRNVNLYNCYFFGDTYFQNVESAHSINFENCKFLPATTSSVDLGKFTITKCKFKNIVINGKQNYNDEKIIKEFKIESSTIAKFEIKNYKIDQLIIDTSSSEIDTIKIVNCSIKEIKIIGLNTKELSIDNLVNNNLLSIEDYTNLTISNSEKENFTSSIKELRIIFNARRKESKLFINEILIESLILTGVINNDVVFRNCSINNIELNDVVNSGSFKFHNITKIEKFTLYNVSLGKAKLMNVRLESAKQVQIINSSIYDIILNNTMFTESIISLSDQDYSGRRELFKQLKYASDKQGDRIHSILFQQYEMQSFKNELTKTRKWYNGDRLIMWASQSNDYGSNWVKSIRLLIIFNIIFYFLIVTSAYLIFLKPSSNLSDWIQTIKIYWIYKPAMFSILNPTYDFDKVFIGGKYNLPAAAFDFFHRTILTYFIFQIVSAFRKFTKELSF